MEHLDIDVHNSQRQMCLGRCLKGKVLIWYPLSGYESKINPHHGRVTS